MSYWKTLEGKTLNDRYHLIRLVGLGGFGAVYEAEDLEFADRVAVKVVHTEFARRVRREGMLGRKFKHRNAVNIENVCVESDPPFIVMEYIDGPSLEELGRLSGSQIRAFVRQVGSALHKAHEQKLVHRDLKPQNILLTQDERTGEDRFVILDFGIASQLGAGDTLRAATMDGAGTPEYMAPEQIRGEEPTPKSDIYSFGVLLYRLLTGRVPFPCDHKSLVTYFSYVDQSAPPRFREILPETSIDPLIEAIVLRCLAKSPAGRPDSMQEIIDYFEDALGPDGENTGMLQEADADGPQEVSEVAASADEPQETEPEDDAPTSAKTIRRGAATLEKPASAARQEAPAEDEPMSASPKAASTHHAAPTESESPPSEFQSTLPPAAIPDSEVPPEYRELPKSREAEAPIPSDPIGGPSTLKPAELGDVTLQPEYREASPRPPEPSVKESESSAGTMPPRDESPDQVTPADESESSDAALSGSSTLRPPAAGGDYGQTFVPGAPFSESATLGSLRDEPSPPPSDESESEEWTQSAEVAEESFHTGQKVKSPAGPKFAALGVLVCLTAGAVAYPYVQRARVQSAVEEFVQGSQYDQARARAEATDQITRLVLETKALIQDIHTAGVTRAQELAGGGKLDEAIAESRRVLAAFPDDPDIARVLQDIADGVRSRIHARTEDGNYEATVRSIRQDPVIQHLVSLENRLIDPQELERDVRDAGIERLRELSRHEQHREALAVARSLQFAFPGDEEVEGLMRAEEVLVTVADGTTLIRDGEFERGIRRLSDALDKQPEREQRQAILFTRATAWKEWAAATTEEQDALARLDAAFADIAALEALGSVPDDAKPLLGEVSLRRARLIHNEDPRGAICDYKVALESAASRADAEKGLLQIAELYAIQGHEQFDSARVDYDPQQPESADRKLESAIDNLGIALLALPKSQDGLDELFARGLARTMLSNPDYVGAVRDLERFQEQARTRLQDPQWANSDARTELRYRHAVALSKLAWLRATSPDAVAQLRDGETALRYAEEAIKMIEALYAESRDDAFLPDLHSALTSQAAALAETKDFNRAIRVTKGVMVNYRPDDAEWQMHNETIEKFYKQQTPYRDDRSPSETREPKPCPSPGNASQPKP